MASGHCKDPHPTPPQAWPASSPCPIPVAACTNGGACGREPAVRTQGAHPLLDATSPTYNMGSGDD